MPLAETDLLAGWLAATAGLAVPEQGALTVATGAAKRSGGRVIADLAAIPTRPTPPQSSWRCGTANA